MGQPTALRTQISVKKQEDPVVVSVDDDVMKGVRKAQMHIRNEFRDFLRSTLSVLEEDIVENIVRVYDHHCSQEDDVLTATLLVAKDNVEKKYFPFVRTFQSSINEASNVCSKPCLAAIQSEHINYKGLKSKTLVNLNENNKSTPGSSWREGDLQIIGALNDLVSWGQSLRQTMLSHYRGHVDAVEKKQTIVQNKKLKPLTNSKKAKKRPSTAGKLRKPTRRPPVGGGFHSSFSVEGDALSTMGLGEAAPGSNINFNKSSSMGAGYTPGDGRERNRIMHHANEMRYKSRNMLRQAMGSYYNFDDSTGRQGGNYPNPFSVATASNRKINNAFKAKRPLRNKSINNKAATKQNRERPSSAKVSRKKFNVKHEFSNLHSNRPSSAHQKRRKPFDIPRNNGDRSLYSSNKRISSSLNSLNLLLNDGNEEDMVLGEQGLNELDSMAYMISNNPNRPENDTSITRYKAVGHAVTPQRKVKSHGKRTVQDIAIEKAALSPWGKEDDYNTKQLSAGKITKSVAKRKPRPKSATSLRNNTQNFRDKDFGVIGSGINGNL